MGAPVAILGAGLTGMSAAHALRAEGVPFRLFEKSDRVGGHAITIEDDGYRFDRTGHLLHVDDERALGWMGRHHVVERRSAVWSHGVYTRYPFQANAHGLPPEVAYACVMGFLEAPRDRPVETLESFEDFCRARFGDAITDRFMLPYNEKLWGVKASEVTARWCERFVPVPTVADVIAGAVGHPLRELGYNTRFVYPERGIGQLSEGMARLLPVELGRAPARIDLGRRRLVFGDEEVPFGALISTAPLPALVSLLEAPPEVRAAGEALRCTHLCYLDVALDEPCGQPYHWIYVPEPRYPFYRVGCYSHFSPAMAPAGKAGLYVELADRAPRLDEVLPGVIEGLVEMGIVRSARAIRFARMRRIDHAYVIFDRRYFDAVATVQRFLADNDIVSTGRYGGWNYSSMGDALRFGREAAARAQAIVTRSA